MSMLVMRAEACGLRTVAPNSIPGTTTSLENSKEPSIFGGTSGRAVERPTRPAEVTAGLASRVVTMGPAGLDRFRGPAERAAATSTTAATMPS